MKTPGGVDSLQGFSPKQMQKALGQIDTNEIEDVQEVIIRTGSEEIVLENPEVTVMNMGQEIWNVVPQRVTKRPLGSSSDRQPISDQQKEVTVKDEDVNLIMNTVQVTREEAIAAIKKSGGDIAAAIMSLK
jgi:nascent polypeptide-associated complex subunit alpha